MIWCGDPLVSGVIGVEIPIEESIVEADLKDPFLVVRLADGSLRVYVVQEDGNLELREPTLADAEVCTALAEWMCFLDIAPFQRSPRTESSTTNDL